MTCDPRPVTCGLDPLKLQLLTAFTSLQQDCPNLKVARTCSTPNTRASFQLITRRVSDEYVGIVEVQVVEMTEAAATKQASVTALHVSVVGAFLQK